MAKQLVNGQERFDGYPVTLYDGRFSGAFDLPEEVGAGLEYDEVVTFVVTATVGKATIASTRYGDLKRTNTLSVLNAVPVPYSAVNAVNDAVSIAGEAGEVSVVELQTLGSNESQIVAASVETFLDDADKDEVFSPGGLLPDPPDFDTIKTQPFVNVDRERQREDRVLQDFLGVG